MEPPDRTAPSQGTDPFTYSLKSPPIDPVRERIAVLEHAGISCALGGSGLLAALGLTQEIRDWDFTVDAPIEHSLGVLVERTGDTVRPTPERRDALAALGADHVGPDELHADEKLVFPRLALELIHHFAFYVKGGVVRIPTRVTRRWNGLPVGSPEGWAVAYALMGRAEKADLLFSWLARHGADGARLAELRDQPLPDSVLERILDFK